MTENTTRATTELRLKYLNLNSTNKEKKNAEDIFIQTLEKYYRNNPFQLTGNPETSKLSPSEAAKLSLHRIVNQLSQDLGIKSSTIFFTDYAAKRKNQGTNSNKLETYGQMKDKILSQEAQILELQAKIKEMEEKMKNNSNAGSVSTTQTFFSANSTGGKRKTQKKRRL